MNVELLYGWGALVAIISILVQWVAHLRYNLRWRTEALERAENTIMEQHQAICLLQNIDPDQLPGGGWRLTVTDERNEEQ